MNGGSLKASKYPRTFAIADGTVMDEDGFMYKGTLESYHIAAIEGKTLKSCVPGAVSLERLEDGTTKATLNGDYTGNGIVDLPKDVSINNVAFNRTFTPNAFSTVVLPFEVNTANVENLEMVLRFNGIGLDANGQKSVKMKVVWKPTKKHTLLEANNPYMVLMNDAAFKVNGPVTFKQTKEAVQAIGNWEFRGMWQYKSWGKNDSELGKAYGFAASTDDNIVAGEFVKAGEGAWINPMRAYLLNNESTQKKAQGVRGNANGAYVLRTSSVREELPEVMNVIVEDEDGESSEKQTTVIGQFNTRTGEFKMNSKHSTFDVKGRSVGNQANKARGAYYSKKVR